MTSKLDRGVMPQGKSDVAWLPTRDKSMLNTHERWTAQDEQFVIDHWGVIPARDIAKAIRRTLAAVKKRAIKLDAVDKTPPWQVQETEILNEFYAASGAKITSENLLTAGFERSERAIRAKAMEMGLRLSSREPIKLPNDEGRSHMTITTSGLVKYKAQQLAISRGISTSKLIEELILRATTNIEVIEDIE